MIRRSLLGLWEFLGKPRVCGDDPRWAAIAEEVGE